MYDTVHWWQCAFRYKNVLLRYLFLLCSHLFVCSLNSVSGAGWQPHYEACEMETFLWHVTWFVVQGLSAVRHYPEVISSSWEDIIASHSPDSGGDSVAIFFFHLVQSALIISYGRREVSHSILIVSLCKWHKANNTRLKYGRQSKDRKSVLILILALWNNPLGTFSSTFQHRLYSILKVHSGT